MMVLAYLFNLLNSQLNSFKDPCAIKNYFGDSLERFQLISCNDLSIYLKVLIMDLHESS